MKVHSLIVVSLMLGCINPLWATSGKDSGGISQQNLDAVKQETADSSSVNIQQAPQAKNEAAQAKHKADNSAKQ